VRPARDAGPVHALNAAPADERRRPQRGSCVRCVHALNAALARSLRPVDLLVQRAGGAQS